ncbi:37005_t:CDS:2, partial [Gigaspora margarita]
MTTNQLPFTTVGIELNRLFTGDYEFHIPEYQRPYEWTTDNAIQLVQDVWEALTRQENDYFLGSIVLASKASKECEPFAVDIIDGQQRITTIILLLSLLRSMQIEEKFTDHITDRLTQREDLLTSRGKRHRFFPSPNIGGDFVKYFLDFDNAYNLVDHINNFAYDEELTCYSRFSGENNHSTKNTSIYWLYADERTRGRNQNSAFRIFSTLNDRGRQLSVIDNLKYLLLTRADSSRREDVAVEFNDFSQMLSEEQFINLITKILPICFEVNSIVDNIDKILQDNSVTAENFVTKLLGPYTLALRHILNRIDIEPLIWLRQFNQTHPIWIALGVEYFRQYESSNTPEQHETFFRELEFVMVYFLLARPFCLNKEITEFIKKWVQKLRQSQITVDPSSRDVMDLDQITFQPSAEIGESKFREAIYKCDVYNYPDISKFVLAKINGKLADPYINVLYPEIDITIEHICPKSAAQPGRVSPWRT